MKTVNYLMIVKHLTGDSSIIFFDTKKEAIKKYNEHVQPLLDVCKEKELEEDEVFYFPFEGSFSDHAIRFYAGVDDDIAALLDDCDIYFKVGSEEIEDNCTHYVADFSEHVDDSTVKFYTKDEATIKWNDEVESSIAICNERHCNCVNRYDQSTWENEEVGTLYQESHEGNISDAYFGYDDVSYTYRISEINIGMKETFFIIADLSNRPNKDGRTIEIEEHIFYLDDVLDREILEEYLEDENEDELNEENFRKICQIYLTEMEIDEYSQSFCPAILLTKEQFIQLQKFTV